jgi:hypothetical protein
MEFAQLFHLCWISITWIIFPIGCFGMCLFMSERICENLYKLDERFGASNIFHKMKPEEKFNTLCLLSHSISLLCSCILPTLMICTEFTRNGILPKNHILHIMISSYCIGFIHTFVVDFSYHRTSLQNSFRRVFFNWRNLLQGFIICWCILSNTNILHLLLVCHIGSLFTFTEYSVMAIGNIFPTPKPFIIKGNKSIERDSFGRLINQWSNEEINDSYKWNQFIKLEKQINNFNASIRTLECYFQVFWLVYWMYIGEFNSLCAIYAFILPSMYSDRDSVFTRLVRIRTRDTKGKHLDYTAPIEEYIPQPPVEEYIPPNEYLPPRGHTPTPHSSPKHYGSSVFNLSSINEEEEVIQDDFVDILMKDLPSRNSVFIKPTNITQEINYNNNNPFDEFIL